MIAILDYGLGNLKSTYNMFKKIGVKSKITNNVNEIKNAEKYILPGVGSFDHGITKLKSSPFFSILEEEVLINKKYILGICLGMQLLTNSSEEGSEKGLCWIDANTIKFKFNKNPQAIPQIGWNQILLKKNNPILKNLNENKFYFLHSYHVVCNNSEDIVGTTDYFGNFISCISHKNIYGVQFHPEKSHKYGMQLFKNFSEI